MNNFTSKLSVIFSFLLVLSLFNGFTGGLVFAEDATPITSVDAPAPKIEPTVVNEHNGTKVLFDNTHGETAGAADWVINGGFSDFGQAIADEGYFVQELRQTTPITYDDLKDYQVFIIPEANVPFKDSEHEAIMQFINNGGSVFFIGDHYNADRNLNRWDAPEVFNGYRRGAYGDPTKGMSTEEANSEAMQGVSSTDWLADNFGIRFRYNAMGDDIATDVVQPSNGFGITEGVDSVAIHAGATLAIVDPTHSKGLVFPPEGVDVWSHAVDQGVYANGGIDEGAFVAISKVGKGKAAFVGDSSVVEDSSPTYLREDNGGTKTTYDGFKEESDGVLLTNLINWLATQEDYTTFENQGITLDQPTPLLDKEAPANSTEPKTEPWSNPPSGYKWYDRTTFEAGSYGSGELAVNPTYNLVFQDTLPGDEQVFKIRLTGEKLGSYATVSDFKVGLYLDGGQQVGEFSLDGQNWPTSYGYSDTFNLAANADGYAEKDVYVKIKAGIEGPAHLRVKQGNDKLFTKDVTIDANATPVDLPESNLPAIPEATNINEVRQLADNNQVTVQGTIVSEPGIFGAQGFYVEDETGGIYVYQSESGLHAGDVVSITGNLTTYNTEREISPSSIIKIDSTDLPEAKEVDQINEANQGELVTLKDVTIENIHLGAGSAIEFDAVKGDYSTTVRIDNRTGITMDTFPYVNGDVADITGISAIFGGNYQLKPTRLKDLNYVYKLAEVRSLDEGQVVTVKGTVTTETGLWGGKAFYMQDATGGIYVYTHNDYDLEPGDVVKITASTASYNDELELTNITSIEKVDKAELPAAKVMDVNQIANHQGELVKVEAVKITDLHQADKYGTTEFTAVDIEGNTVTVRLDNRTGTKFTEFPYQNGDVLFVTGLASTFKGDTQIKPRGMEDFTLLNIDWIINYVNNSNIEPKGIKTAILAKLNASEKNAKHLEDLASFIENSNHIMENVKNPLDKYVKALQ